jgi:hypothetical protein
MGTLLEDLEGHEGYVLWQLADGTLTAAWTLGNRRQLTAYVAECECGWRSTRQHPATDHGDEAAREEWVREHAVPELAQQQGRLQDPDDLRRVAEGLAWASELTERLERDLGWSASRPGGRP